MPVPTPNNFAAYIEARASEPADYVCFLDAETGQACTYFQLRLRGAWLARELEAQGVERGGVCAIDMQNCPAFMYALVAAAYGGFSLVLLNNHLSESEKTERIEELKRAGGFAQMPILDEATALALIEEADTAGPAMRNRVSAWTRRGVGAFDELAPAVYAFTSGATGRQKVAALSWEQLLGAARACNSVLATEGEGIWQLVLPAYHVDGLQVFFRSVLNKNAFLLYRSFDAEKVLADAYTYAATHIAVLETMLEDLLNTAERDAEQPTRAQLSSYTHIMLSGGQPSVHLCERARASQAPVYATYGMTETSSYVALAPATNGEAPLKILPGYECTIVAPDEAGFGQLAVRGPGVVDGYVNARAAFTADGFFLTGDTARLEGSALFMAKRARKAFVSGGEDIYPEDICEKICAVEGVSDAHVFGSTDAHHGRRPIAFVEARDLASRPGFNSFYFADDLRNRLGTRLSALQMPDQFVVMDEFPRSGMGKLSAGSLERAWNTRIHVAQVELWQVRLPLVAPIRTAKTKLRQRDTLLVRISDYEGRTGVGECASFADDWYLPETLGQDVPFIRDVLAPLLLGRVLLHPGEVSELFENAAGSAERPFACAALEMACWDLYGKIRQRSIAQLIGARLAATEEGALHELPAGSVAGGVVINNGSASDMCAAVDAAVQAGYKRVKLKIKPGADIDIVKAVREAHPRLMIMLDADQSYKDTQIDVLQQLDAYDITCIEEPLDPGFTPTVGPKDLFDRLSRVQQHLRMRVCLDKSWTNAEQLYTALESHPELRCVSLKIGKFGGVAAALAFQHWAGERGIEVWPGGMYETGVSKRIHAAFGLLPGVNLPGDISSSTRYFTVDVCTPPFVLENGVLQVNGPDALHGLGCSLDEDALSRVTEAHWVRSSAASGS